MSIIYNVDPERATALGYDVDDNSPEGAVSLDEAKKILSDDPSDENKQIFIDIYGAEKFEEWQKESSDDSKASLSGERRKSRRGNATQLGFRDLFPGQESTGGQMSRRRSMLSGE